MGTYTGCIIEESLKDKAILDEFNILETREDDGISYIVEIEDSKVEEILTKLKQSMVDEPIWYIDLKNYDYHYIIFNDKIFKVDRICNMIEKSLRGENSFLVKELETGMVLLGWNQHFIHKIFQ